MHTFFLHAVIALSLLSFTIDANAFDVDGYHSGMTREQLIAEAAKAGFDAKEAANGDWWVVGRLADPQIHGTFSFCEGTLDSYIRMIDFDLEYIPLLNSLIGLHGQPHKVQTNQRAWSGSGGGTVQGVEMIWHAGNDRITLSFYPEGRDGEGQLRHLRNASIYYYAKTRCTKEF